MSSLYVHIPFCASICAYCDFPKVYYRSEWAFSYLEALFFELDKYKGEKYDSIYVGGGTPTSLSDEDFSSLLYKLSEFKRENCEWSIESNPESLSEEKLSICRSFGVNRISIGIESSSPRLLSLMGRKHSFLDGKKAIDRARKAGISNINADLIYALPNESEEEAKKDIEAFLSLSLPHLSAYSLIVEKGTRFFLDGYREMGDEEAAKQYELILSSFRKAGYDRYEVSNFSLPGYECRHNLTYWEDEEYDAVGLGASGYRGGIRYKNTLSLSNYLKGNYRAEIEKVSPKDELEYYFLTNLRLEKGFSLLDFEKRFGFPFLEKYEKAYLSNHQSGLLKIEEGRLKPTDLGMLLLDRILLSLFE